MPTPVNLPEVCPRKGCNAEVEATIVRQIWYSRKAGQWKPQGGEDTDWRVVCHNDHNIEVLNGKCGPIGETLPTAEERDRCGLCGHEAEAKMCADCLDGLRDLSTDAHTLLRWVALVLAEYDDGRISSRRAAPLFDGLKAAFNEYEGLIGPVVKPREHGDLCPDECPSCGPHEVSE